MKFWMINTNYNPSQNKVIIASLICFVFSYNSFKQHILDNHHSSTLDASQHLGAATGAGNETSTFHRSRIELNALSG